MRQPDQGCVAVFEHLLYSCQTPLLCWSYLQQVHPVSEFCSHADCVADPRYLVNLRYVVTNKKNLKNICYFFLYK